MKAWQAITGFGIILWLLGGMFIIYGLKDGFSKMNGKLILIGIFMIVIGGGIEVIGYNLQRDQRKRI